MHDMLISKLTKSQRKVALKKERIAKWEEMAAYDLDPDIKHMIKIADNKLNI